MNRRERTDNLIEWIESSLREDESIESVVIGSQGYGGWGYDEDYNPKPKPDWAEKLLTWEEAKPHLNYRFYSGFGSPGCHAIYVWTDHRILFIAEYDGSTQLASVPRHPQDCSPQYSGDSNV